VISRVGFCYTLISRELVSNILVHRDYGSAYLFFKDIHLAVEKFSSSNLDAFKYPNTVIDNTFDMHLALLARSIDVGLVTLR